MREERPSPISGLFDGPYWDFAAKGELRLQQCAVCDAFRYPPGPCCPVCLSVDAEWTRLSGHGRIVSWTVFHRQYFPQMPVPYTVASIETQEGPLLIGNLLTAAASDLKVGAAVCLEFQPITCDGAKFNLPQWRLAPSGEPP